MTETGIILEYQSEGDLVVEWRISNFFTLPEEDSAWHWSPEFSFGGVRWYLWIYPNGSSGHDSSGHVDLYLCKCHFDRFMRHSFSLSLKTAKGEKYREEHCTRDFKVGLDFHKFNRFIQRSELARRRSELVPEGVLTVVCTMKSSPSAESESNSAAAETSDSVSDSAGCSSDSGECCHCKGNFVTGSLSTHQRKCTQRPVKCPDCLEIVVLQKWFDEHKCQQERPEGVGSLFEDYKKVLLDGRHHDLILKVSDKELRAHRDILRARSRVFESMLDHDMKERNTGIIDVPDCDPNAMELFLSYVYYGKIEALNHSNMLGLYYVADKYEMMELKRQCCNFIKKSLSLTNICSVIQLALKHSDSDLLEYATGYFAENMLNIMKTVEWQCFLKGNSTIGNELLIKSIELKNTRN